MSQKKIKPKDKRNYELELNNKLLRDRLSELYVLCSWLLNDYLNSFNYENADAEKATYVRQDHIQQFIDTNQAMIVERLDDGSVKLRIGHLEEENNAV